MLPDTDDYYVVSDVVPSGGSFKKEKYGEYRKEIWT